MNPELVILDADHTLYTPVADRAYRDMFAALADTATVSSVEARSTWEDHYRRCREEWSGGEDYRAAAIRATLEALGATPTTGLVEEVQTRFWDRVADDIVVEERTRTMLERLVGAYTLVVATDELPGPLERKIDASLGGMDVFDAVVTARDTGTLKPSPRFCTIPLERFGTSPDKAVMVGDSWERDLAPASRLGLTTVHLTQEETLADHRIDTITELPDIFGDA